MNSGSPAFEAGYAAFLDDVFSNSVWSAEAVDTPTYRAVIVAGVRRLRADKATGMLSEEVLERRADGTHSWRNHSNNATESRPLVLRARDWQAVLQAVWRDRVVLFMPGAKECFESIPGWSAEDQFLHMVGLAAKRRASLVAARTLCAVLWQKVFDAEVARLAVCFFGSRRATFARYNLIAAQKAEFAALYAETPNLAPVMGLHVLTDAVLASGGPLPRDLLVRARDALFTWSRDDGSATVKLAPASWRYLAGSSAPVVQEVLTLLEHGFAGGDINVIRSGVHVSGVHVALGLLAGCAARPPLTFVSWLVAERNLVSPSIGGSISELVARAQTFVRLAAAEAVVQKRKKRVKRFATEELTLVCDWFMAAVELPHLEQGAVPRNATWGSLMRAQRAWHAERAERAARDRAADEVRYREWQAERDAASWPSLVGPVEVDGYSATPLTCGAALRFEGEAEQQDHCVADYVEACAEGLSRIFAVSGRGERATVELAIGRTPKTWSARQVFGAGNTRSSRAMHAAARKLAKLYSAQEALACKP